MTSIERTAYPRFKRLLSARELHVFFTPQSDEVAWARSAAGPDEHVLALVVWLKCFGRLGYFPALETVPAAVVDHVRRDLGLAEGIAAVHAAARRPAQLSGTGTWSASGSGWSSIPRGRGRWPPMPSGKPPAPAIILPT